MRPHEKRVSLNNVDLGLEQCCAYSQQRLVPVGKFDPDQIRLDQSQTGTFENLTPLLGMAEQEANECTFGRVVDRERNDANLAALESADDFQKLTNPVFEKDSKLPDCRVVATSHCGKIGPISLAKAHSYLSEL